MNIRIVTDGLQDTRDFLRTRLPREMDRAAELGLEAAADVILRRSRQLVPVRTGRLRRSLREIPGVLGGGMSEIGVGSDVPYSEFVERREPFLARAVDERRQEAIGAMRQAITQYIEGVN